jgi:cytidylate kinase
MIIAIDGPAGSGKSTTAKLVAERLGILHLDTGAMYRCITLKGLESKIPYQDHKKIGEMSDNTEINFTMEQSRQQVLMDKKDVTEAIRSPEVTANVSDYCAVPVVREILVEQQRRIGRQQSSVLEGRDIGTVVFPDADFKFFLIADPKVRAERRQKELAAKGIRRSIEELVTDITERDRKDMTRSHSPLKKADTAVEIDTTALTIEEQVEKIIGYIKNGNRV